MKEYADLTTDEKTKINKFFDNNQVLYSEYMLGTDYNKINVIFFLYDNINQNVMSMGTTLNNCVKYYTQIEKKTDINALIEHLNIDYEFIFVNFRYKPTLY